ncbi:MAG: UvrB/UvrC motif-containing protein, partial [Lentisphaeria bacterium]|nr:UvrB/UvrC motif-containing protein [Lentisphaeria bacterium]
IDLPSVTLVAILDADKEGFLRSGRSLIQVAGRAARNAQGRVILYGDTVTPAMQQLLDTTADHRKRQQAYNQQHGIVPKTIEKSKRESISDVVKSNNDRHAASEAAASIFGRDTSGSAGRIEVKNLSEKELSQLIYDLEVEMLSAAENLEFERAAKLRDKLNTLTDNRFVQNYRSK